MTKTHIHLGLLALVLAVLLWSGIAPYDRFTWWMEIFPVLIAAPILVLIYKRFPLTTFLYVIIALHAIILMIGGHYTYARVPAFDWLRDYFHLSRNHYDRIGHFMQGFGPALVGRELLLRTSNLQRGKWLFAILLLGVLGISAVYEIIEWATAALTSEAAESFLGTQGDVWDTQKDMTLALIGAFIALSFFSRFHDKALKKMEQDVR